MPFLAIDTPNDFRVVELEPGLLRMGRSPLADVDLEDPSASRRHARLIVRPDEVEIVDDGSENGTWVNGRRVFRAVLRHGDAIRVGRTLMCFVDTARQEALALAA